jgi:hypothetical protein
MDDITKKYEFQQILHDAAQYRALRRIIEADRRVAISERRFKEAGLAPNNKTAGAD